MFLLHYLNSTLLAVRGQGSFDPQEIEIMSDGRKHEYKTAKAPSRQSEAADQSSRVPFRNPNQSGMTLERPPLFLGILAADYERIGAAARITEFARGEMLYRERDAVTQLILLTSGCVKITQLGSSGSQVIIRFGLPGDALGAVSLYSTGRHSTSAQAHRACQALVWDARTFRAMLDRFSVLHQNLVRLVGQELQEIEERFREVATERVALRIARQLLRLIGQMGHQVNGEIEIRLSREELAQMTGTTLFTVSRLFSAWEAQGIVKPRRENVTICDVESLRAISSAFPRKIPLETARC